MKSATALTNRDACDPAPMGYAENGRPGPSGWTPERRQQALELWAEGLSAREIANRLGCVSRNAVIGVVHRAGKSKRDTPANPRGRPKSTTAKVVKLPKAPAVKRAPSQNAGLAFRTRTFSAEIKPMTFGDARKPPASAKPWEQRGLFQCAFPFDVGGEAWSCCEPVKPGSSYCPDCHGRMFREPTKAEKRAVRRVPAVRVAE
jgi:hypothetical protein